METIDLESWAAYKVTIEELQKRAAKEQRLLTPIVYRGQSDSEWKLETTLERAGKKGELASNYHISALMAHKRLGNIIERQWPVDENLDWSGEYPIFKLHNYGFWAFLRQYGFPSPFLDWTQSPYVAAYFAFVNRTKATDRVAIFVHQEMMGSILSGLEDGTRIQLLGPWESVDRKHLMQQSWYSICWKKNAGNRVVFCEHEEAEVGSIDGVSRNKVGLTKLTLPVTERMDAMQDLFLMNINTYSLFGTTEALVETIGRTIFERIGQ